MQNNHSSSTSSRNKKNIFSIFLTKNENPKRLNFRKKKLLKKQSKKKRVRETSKIKIMKKIHFLYNDFDKNIIKSDVQKNQS